MPRIYETFKPPLTFCTIEKNGLPEKLQRNKELIIYYFKIISSKDDSV